MSSVKENITGLIKSPLFWMVLSIVAVTIVIIITGKSHSTTPTEKCPDGKIRDITCGNKCRDICSDPLVWDCKEGKCNCPPDHKQCGDTLCCKSDDCFTPEEGDPICCPSDKLCPDPTDKNKKICCPSDKLCINNSCVASCGLVDGKPIACEGKTPECLKIEFQNSDQRSQFMKDFTDLKLSPRLSSDEKTGFVCLPKSDCNWDTEQQRGIVSYLHPPRRS